MALQPAANALAANTASAPLTMTMGADWRDVVDEQD
jgi:hypothetical protein